jgi:ferritin-like metal-binding protein YciE
MAMEATEETFHQYKTIYESIVKQAEETKSEIKKLGVVFDQLREEAKKETDKTKKLKIMEESREIRKEFPNIKKSF